MMPPMVGLASVEVIAIRIISAVFQPFENGNLSDAAALEVGNRVSALDTAIF